MTVKERFMAHMKPSTSKLKRNYKIYNAISKYGADNFYVETLEDNIPLDKLNEKEIQYISLYDSYNNGYNSTPGGDGRIINLINNEEELLSLAKSGISAKELAKKFNVHKATIYRTLHKLGFYYYKNDKQILDLVNQGLSNKDISLQLNIDEYSVSRCLTRNNKRKHRIPLNKRENFDYEGLFNDYNNQMPIKNICEKYDISETVLNRVRAKYGIKTRPQIYYKRCNT